MKKTNATKQHTANVLPEQRVCFYCKHFFCVKYHMLLCDGGLPQWELLTSLMRDVKASDTCDQFELHKIYKQKQR